MSRTWTAFACLFLLVGTAPSVLAYRDCYLGACADYDYRGSRYAEVQYASYIVGAGAYAPGGPYEGYTVHAFAPGNYVAVYDGSWYGQDFTLIVIGVNGQDYVWYHQEARASEHPTGYHCYSVASTFSRCGAGLP